MTEHLKSFGIGLIFSGFFLTGVLFGEFMCSLDQQPDTPADIGRGSDER